MFIAKNIYNIYHMGTVHHFIAAIEVFTGIIILLFSLLPLRQIILLLPKGVLRTNWLILGTMIVIFIAGYAGYALTFWKQHLNLSDLIVPSVFALGSCFVWLTTTLSLRTAVDVRRVSLLERENITDELVGIYNRRYLERFLREEFLRARHYSLPLSVLLLDLDHFKEVNDQLGHPIGDEVLRSLGRMVIKTVRQSDIVARYGGDEFMIIAPGTSLSMAEVLAERLRSSVENQSIPVSNLNLTDQNVNVTISIGVVGLNVWLDSTEKLVQAADHALYTAKQSGRNKVVVCSATSKDSLKYTCRSTDKILDAG